MIEVKICENVLSINNFFVMRNGEMTLQLTSIKKVPFIYVIIKNFNSLRSTLN